MTSAWKEIFEYWLERNRPEIRLEEYKAKLEEIICLAFEAGREWQAANPNLICGRCRFYSAYGGACFRDHDKPEDKRYTEMCDFGKDMTGENND